MYSLEINFLKDREPVAPVTGNAPPPPTPLKEKLIMFLGVGIGLLLPLSVGGFWLWQQNETASLEKELADVNVLLEKAAGEKGNLDKINQDTKNTQQQIQDLTTIFEQIKPWSAMLQDIRERIPLGVQVSGITQSKATPTAAASPAPGATPPSLTDKVEIVGISNSFSSVNDLVLTLQKSPFFKDTETKLVSASLIENPIQLTQAPTTSQTTNQQLPKLPQVVSFKIQTSLNEKQASEMLSMLESKGALGLVTRIESIKQLKEQGVIK